MTKEFVLMYCIDEEKDKFEILEMKKKLKY
jgi:hypothetical protein